MKRIDHGQYRGARRGHRGFGFHPNPLPRGEGAGISDCRLRTSDTGAAVRRCPRTSPDFLGYPRHTALTAASRTLPSGEGAGEDMIATGEIMGMKELFGAGPVSGTARQGGGGHRLQ